MQTADDSSEKPRSDQLRDLRRESDSRGVTFAWPRTSTEADAELARLRGQEEGSFAERAIDRREIDRAMAGRGGDARVRESEIEGYGSSARWKVGR